MLKLLHTADWQIGRQFGRFDPEDAAALAEARFIAVERIAALATSERVDAVLVAGDVFDAQTVSAKTIRRLFNATAGYIGPWLMIPGNHDAALGEGVWTQAGRLGAIPQNVRVALTPGVIELADLRLAALCAPLTQRHTHDDLTAWFDGHDTPAGWWRIGLAHGAVQGLLAEDIDSANPLAPDRAARARLDYLALGDWHGTRAIDERTWYSGTPEPDRFRNNDAGQVLIVEIDHPGAAPRVTPRRIGQHRWRQLDARIDVASDVDAVIALLAGCEAGDVLDLTLAGRVDLAGRQRLAAAIGEAEGRLRALRDDLSALRLAPTDEDIAALHADGYLGEVIAELRDAGDAGGAGHTGDGDRAVAQDALAILTTLLAERAGEADATAANGAGR